MDWESNRTLLTFRAALGLTLVVAALSVAFVVIGIPYTAQSATMQCSSESPCITVSQPPTTIFVPELIAIVPLAAALVVCLGLVIQKMALSWIGAISIGVFAILGIFSIGFFYFPLSMVLVALLAALQSRKRIT